MLEKFKSDKDFTRSETTALFNYFQKDETLKALDFSYRPRDYSLSAENIQIDIHLNRNFNDVDIAKVLSEAEILWYDGSRENFEKVRQDYFDKHPAKLSRILKKIAHSDHKPIPHAICRTIYLVNRNAEKRGENRALAATAEAGTSSPKEIQTPKLESGRSGNSINADIAIEIGRADEPPCGPH